MHKRITLSTPGWDLMEYARAKRRRTGSHAPARATASEPELFYRLLDEEVKFFIHSEYSLVLIERIGRTNMTASYFLVFNASLKDG
jgi:hypothetical protein